MSSRNLEKLYFLKAIGYEFVSESFLNEEKKLKFSSLKELNTQIKNCSLCYLKNQAKNTLLGCGNPQSKLMFVALEPSFSEDEGGEFLSGLVADKFLNLVKKSLNLNKHDFYFTSVLRCKSKENSGIIECFERCKPYLFDEIDMISPKVIVTLGERAFLNLYPDGDFLSMRSSLLRFRDFFIMPTYSLSRLIKNPSLEAVFLRDLSSIKGYL